MSKTQKKLVVRKLSTNFREAVNIETAPICEPNEGEICVKNKYVSINVDDINVTKGLEYFTRGKEIPFGAGLEGIGTVVAIGKGVTRFKVGDLVACMADNHNTFAEYACVPEKLSFLVPEILPEYLVILICGFTSYFGVHQFGQLKKGEKILITAATGGVGHIMVQLAKKAGCYVIGTCSSKDKEQFLKELGCDHIINYKEEDLSEVLTKHYPEGLDAIWETVGGTMFNTCLKHIGYRGRYLAVGGTSAYQSGEQDTPTSSGDVASFVSQSIFYKAASIIGVNMDVYEEIFEETYQVLLNSYHQGEIRAVYSLGDGTKEFVGMEGIIEAVEYLFKRKHCGKIIVKIY